MKRKQILFDILFIIGTAVILLLINESGKTDMVTPYSFLLLYASYLIGRFSAIFARK